MLRQGRILLADGRWERVPDYLLDDEQITWPPGLPEKKAGENIAMFSADDFYYRHEVGEGEFYVYLKKDISLESIPEETIQKLLGR